MAALHNWSFFQSFYFCFSLLLTLGPGSLSPNEASLSLCVLYIFLGLILVSTCYHILKDEVVTKLETDRDTGRGNRKEERKEWKETQLQGRQS